MVPEASDGIAAFSRAMEAWMSGWPEALRGVGVPIFKTAGDGDKGRS